MKKKVIIATHDGKFHSDEVIAVWFLRWVYRDNVIIRTRDPDVINQANIVVDVGGVHDPARDRFDHHQSTFNLTFTGSTIPLSSAGLVWLKYGKQLIKDHFGPTLGISLTSLQIDVAYNELYHTLIKEIDGNDNGVPQYTSDGRIKFNYNTNLTLIGIITAHNSRNVTDHTEQYKRFKRAVNVCDQILVRIEKCLEKIACYESDLIYTNQIIKESKKSDPTGSILVIPGKYILNLKKCLKDKGVYNNVKYTITKEGDTSDEWIIKAMPANYKQYETKKDILPLELVRILRPDLPSRIKYLASPGYFAKVIGLSAALELALLSLSINFRSVGGEHLVNVCSLSGARGVSLSSRGPAWVTLNVFSKVVRLLEYLNTKGYQLQVVSEDQGGNPQDIKYSVIIPGSGPDQLITRSVLRDFGLLA